MGKYSDNLKDRVLTKGPSEGFCAICGEFKKLTKDHVPPKGVNNLRNSELRELMRKDIERGVTSQGGTHFKTICEICNNERLGRDYDSELVRLSNEITSCVKSASNNIIALPETIRVVVKSQRVARCVIGHLLAAVSVDIVKQPPQENPMDDALKEYFMNESLPLPEHVDIYYWVYPSKKQIVVKYFGKRNINTGAMIIGHTIKFLPLGFFLTWKKPDNYHIPLKKLLPNKNIHIDDEKLLDIDLYEHVPLEFPEKPNDDEFMVFNSGKAYTAIPK